jgi:hypothetical protein
VCLAAALGLGSMLAAPVASAQGTGTIPLATAPLGPTSGARGEASSLYSGYYQNLVGALSLAATFTVPPVKCTNHSTWGSKVGVLALMDSSSGQLEHGGGVEVGCDGVTGAPTYAGAICDPTFASGCGALSDPVAPGDMVKVTVVAAGGCSSTCSSVTVTVNDTTAPWTETWTGSSQSDFDTFVAVVGAPPLPNFGKVALTSVTANGKGFDGQRFNLVDHDGKTLARASSLRKGKTSFSVKWIAAS